MNREHPAHFCAMSLCAATAFQNGAESSSITGTRTLGGIGHLIFLP
jgi:hypothetical protein